MVFSSQCFSFASLDSKYTTYSTLGDLGDLKGPHLTGETHREAKHAVTDRNGQAVFFFAPWNRSEASATINFARNEQPELSAL